MEGNGKMTRFCCGGGNCDEKLKRAGIFLKVEGGEAVFLVLKDKTSVTVK